MQTGCRNRSRRYLAVVSVSFHTTLAGRTVERPFVFLRMNGRKIQKFLKDLSGSTISDYFVKRMVLTQDAIPMSVVTRFVAVDFSGLQSLVTAWTVALCFFCRWRNPFCC